MDHASYINKLVLSNGDKFPDCSAAADQQWISNPWKCAAYLHLYHGEDRFNGRGSVFGIFWSEQMLLCLWETVLCLSSDSSGCCRNAVFKNMKPRRFREKLMIQLLLSTAEGLKKHHSLGQIFVKAAMFVQLFPLFSSSCWWISPPIATPALLIFQQADIKTSTSMLTLLTLGHFWQRFKGGAAPDPGGCEPAKHDTVENKKGQLEVANMVRLSFDACSHETASIFNISQPLICSGSLIPYSRSHCSLFIYELSNMLPAKQPNLIPPSGSCHQFIHNMDVYLLWDVTQPAGTGSMYCVAAGIKKERF